ncbi:hypothetical protein [Sphingobium sp. YBL2]|uniref:hypothetical protein n=1 Tax=Sphingobium sp. (strain YBL2) TaxID=484429 RepID=UPI0012EDD189|nr:hypothetical protein [Sphingobium sp. YBL2]
MTQQVGCFRWQPKFSDYGLNGLSVCGFYPGEYLRDDPADEGRPPEPHHESGGIAGQRKSNPRQAKYAGQAPSLHPALHLAGCSARSPTLGVTDAQKNDDDR